MDDVLGYMMSYFTRSKITIETETVVNNNILKTTITKHYYIRVATILHTTDILIFSWEGPCNQCKVASLSRAFIGGLINDFKQLSDIDLSKTNTGQTSFRTWFYTPPFIWSGNKMHINGGATIIMFNDHEKAEISMVMLKICDILTEYENEIKEFERYNQDDPYNEIDDMDKVD